MKAEELLRSGSLEDALRSLQDEVRQKAQDVDLRTFLFQLLCVLGQWDRALTQLKVLRDLGSDHALLARIFEPVIQCERLRAGVFAGERKPVVFGEPLEWVGGIVQAVELSGKGQHAAAKKLLDQSFEQAPPTSGKLDDKPFEWIADADTRFGPILEVIVEGCYYWIPYCRIQSIHLEAPEDLRDLVWLPAHFVWENGGSAFGHIPTRYPGTEQTADGPLRLARKTEWSSPTEGFTVGLGQRLLATDAEDHPLLECRVLELQPSA